MNHFRAHSDIDSASLNRDTEGANILERFRLICKFSHMSDDVMKQIDAIQQEYNKTGFFSQKSWLKFVELFEIVAHTRKQSNVLFMDPNKKSASKQMVGAKFINESLFEFRVSIIRGVLGSLKREIHTLQSGPMPAEVAEDIIEIERTIGYFSKLLVNPHANIDWHMLRAFMDSAEERVQNTRRVSAELTVKIDAIIKNTKPVEKAKEQPIPVPTADEMRELKREYAWGAFLKGAINGKHATNYKMEDIKAKLEKAGFSYDATTNTIIRDIKYNQPEIRGLDALDMNNDKTKKAAVRVIPKLLQEQGNRFTELGPVLRDDLHKIHGTRAANGDLMYNTLAETFSGTSTWDPIDLSVAGFDEFQILTHEKNAPNSPWHTLRVSAKKHGSSVREILTIMCKPEEVRAGAQARFAIKTRLPAQPGEKEAKYTTTIEFLEVSRIRNMKKTYGNTASNSPAEPKSFWDKTKDSVKNTWKDWFSKKAA